MKKTITCIILLLLIGLLVMPASAATEEHPHSGNHCVCGGSAVGVHDHSCANISWQAMPTDTKDFSKLADGNYYLTQDMTITGATAFTGKKLTICLNGYDIGTTTTAVFGYAKQGSVINICDCSGSQDAQGNWTWGGTITANRTGIARNYGGVLAQNANTTANIYGGNFVGSSGGNGIQGGVFNICNDGHGGATGDQYLDKYDTNLNIYNGYITGGDVSKNGGVINSWHYVHINLYGGTIEGGTGANRGNLNISADTTMIIENCTIIGGNPSSVLVMNGTNYVAQYLTLTEALSKVKTGEHIRLLGDINEAVTISSGVCIDLAGNDLSGVTVENGALFIDSTTDSYNGNLAGSLTPAAGATTVQYKFGGRRYLTVENDGVYSFHRFYVGITKFTLKPGTLGMGYKATFAGSDDVKARLNSTVAYGYKIWVMEDNKIDKGYPSSRFDGKQELTLRIDNFIDSSLTTDENNRRAQLPVYACVYIQLDDGTMLESAPVSHTFQKHTEAADTVWKDLSNGQKDALVTMYSKFEELMDPWKLPNLRAGYIEDWMQISIQRDCSHAVGNTVNPGEKITYTMTLTNCGDKAQTVSVRENIPTNTEYVSGGQMENSEICFQISLEAGETKQISYTVQVKNDMELCNGSSVLGGGRELFIEYTLNDIDGQYFVKAVQALQDSSYSGMDLANRLYVHGFSQSVLTNNAVTETALEDIISGKNTVLLDMVAPTLFGGKSMPDKINGVKGASAGTITKQDLINGDILLADNKIYAYADGLWLLEKGAKKQDTATVLAALPEMEKYAVLRPSVALAGIITPSDMDATPDELNDYQKAVIATAEAYLLRGEKLQYADTYFTTQGSKLSTEYRWQSKLNAPEDCTSTQWGYINCAAFTYEVYYQGLGFALPDNMYTTNSLVNRSEGNGTQVYHYQRGLDSIQTDEEKAQVEKEFTELLQPGDIIVVLWEGGYGHAMLYVGNGNIIHSGGNVYQYTASVGTEVYEASIRRMKVQDYLFNPASAKGYVFKTAQDLAIIRPLMIFDGAIPQNTLNRLENMQGIMAQKLSSHSKAQTVNPGQEMTFTYEIYNSNNTAVTLEILEQLPDHTTYVSGAETVSGRNLSWQVTIPADSRVQVSYKLKVDENTPYGSAIQSTASTVGGVTVKCPAVQVRRTLTAEEQEKLIQAAKEMRASDNTLTGLALANKLYEAATGEADIFASTDIETVMEGTDGVFAKKQMSTETNPRQIFMMNTGSIYQDMLAPTLYGGYRMWTPRWQQDRTRLPKEHDLQVGDVLIGRILSSRVIYMYLGEELGFVNLSTATLDASAVTAEKQLERLLGYGYYFAILRPSFAMETE